MLRPLPRRPFLEAGEMAYGPPPMRLQAPLQAGFWSTMVRFAAWLRAGLRYGSGTLLDRLLRRDSPESRARRLRQTLEQMGGTFLKLGQQLSIRVDLLPMATCNELSKLLDRVEPFPTAEAIAAVERATGRPLGETFAAFDPEPIGSASMACVYQALLPTGELVAVKVRRPGIRKIFGADWRALDWIVRLLELLTLVRPGQLRSFLRDLQTLFLEELDFRREARNAHLFRRRAKRSRLGFLSAPKVYFELSNEEVLVSEFVAGVWLWELLWAVESGDATALSAIRERGIDPEKVGRRLFRTSLFGIFENLIFHADPHPANVVVRPGNQLVLVDFGSCGSYNERQLHILRQFHSHHARGDVSGMVQCALELLEPLPPVDVDDMTREVEEVFAESVRAIESRHSEWWERTSASVWLGFMRMARKYRVKVDLEVLRMVRSTLLYDTLAARLDPDLDIYAEYQRYRREMAAGSRRRFGKRFRRFLRRGVDDRLFLRLEELGGLAQRTTYRLQRLVDAPAYKFSALAGKAFYAVSAVVEWAGWSLGLGVLGMAAVLGLDALAGEPLDASAALVAVTTAPLYLGAVGLLLLATMRRILFRFGDREV